MADTLRTLDILCKVVDNYGDIGVVYRLARALSGADPALRLRLIVDDLRTFALLAPGIDPDRAIQEYRGWTVVSWNPVNAFYGEVPSADSGSSVRELFRADPPRHILECFACGRPDWFEEILFDPADMVTRHMVNLEYLSAETWVDEFHRMPSLTRSPLVKKYVFMPGFTPATGGLVIDAGFLHSREIFRAGPCRGAARRELLAMLPGSECGGTGGSGAAEDRFWISVFSYEHDFTRIVADMAAFGRTTPILALIAAGRSRNCFMDAWLAAGSLFPVIELPFLPQETWDKVMLASDFSIVRGEESLARAALSGRPFLWHAYVQEKSHQLVKVRALLDRMRTFFSPDVFVPLERLWIAFNDRLLDTPDACGHEALLPVLTEAAAPDGALAASCASFSGDLVSHGDLASSLLTFLRELL